MVCANVAHEATVFYFIYFYSSRFNDTHLQQDRIGRTFPGEKTPSWGRLAPPRTFPCTPLLPSKKKSRVLFSKVISVFFFFAGIPTLFRLVEGSKRDRSLFFRQGFVFSRVARALQSMSVVAALTKDGLIPDVYTQIRAPRNRRLVFEHSRNHDRASRLPTSLASKPTTATC